MIAILNNHFKKKKKKKLIKRKCVDAVANVLNSDIIVNEFELQSRYEVHFRTNILGKSMDPLIHTHPLVMA